MSLRFEETAFVFWKTGNEGDARACLHAADLFRGPIGENPLARSLLQRLMRPTLEAMDQESGADTKGSEEPSLIVQP